jgi:FkbM family methyltransferase
MIQSIRNLLEAPYNKKHLLFALKRFTQWKLIRIFKRRNVHYRLWDNRAWILDYDSLQSMWIMYNYILDWEEFNLIKSYVNAGDQIMDIGANVGAYSVWMTKFVNPPGMLHSFEPDEENFKKLQINISINNIGDRVQANKCALSDKDGILHFTTGLDRENHISDGKEENIVSVNSRMLDTYFEENAISKVTYMKIDVEGFEYMVLKGARKILSGKGIEILQLEINHTVQNVGLSAEDLLRLLKEFDYSLCRYDVEVNQLIPIEYHKERENYFAVSDLKQVNLKLKAQGKR